MAYDVFISYSSKNKPVADAVCTALENENIPCWIAPRDIHPGDDWSESIIKALTECRVLILIFSSHANESQQVKREAERAVSKGLALLPLRIEDVYPTGSMEYYLSTSHWLDALTPPMESHLERLVESVRLLLTGQQLVGQSPSANVGAPPDGWENNVAGIAPTSWNDFQPSRGFNLGAFLMNRSWLSAHHKYLGCFPSLLLLLPYLGLVWGLIFGWHSVWSYLPLIGVLYWLLIGINGNHWAVENRHWINAQHFQQVQKKWAIRGLIFWAIVAIVGGVFVRSGWNDKTAALIQQGVNNPKISRLWQGFSNIGHKLPLRPEHRERRR